MVLCWVMVYGGGHKRCRWCGLGFRAVLVGVAVSPGALLSPGVLVGMSWISSVAGRCGAIFGVMEKVEFPPPTPARMGRSSPEIG
jgi:hypothetical protein